MSQPLLVIAAGGTGGHMFPAQALAEVMLERGWRVKLSTDPRGARYTGAFPEKVDVEVVNSGTFARGGLIAKFLVPLRILGGSLAAYFGMTKDRPAVVAGFGGYPTIPAMFSASWHRVPRLIHEQNGVLGRVNRFFAKRVDIVACGTWPTKLPGKVEGVNTGNPVRASVLDYAGASYVPPNFGPLHIVVIGGSQGARILSDVVPKAIAALPENMRFRVMITQQARPEDSEKVRAAYREMEVEAHIDDFISDVPERFAQAQLIISRAGASSVADISVIGRPSILIPYAAATKDHQTANAKGLESAGAAIVIPESALDANVLSSQIHAILHESEKAQKMAEAAVRAGKPNAAEELADLVEALAT